MVGIDSTKSTDDHDCAGTSTRVFRNSAQDLVDVMKMCTYFKGAKRKKQRSKTKRGLDMPKTHRKAAAN